MAQRVKNLLGQEDPLEKDMATHSSILAWRIPWTEKPGPWGHKESDTTEPLHFLFSDSKREFLLVHHPKNLLLCPNPQPRKRFHHPLSCSSKEARGHSSLSSSGSSCKSSRLYFNVSRVHPRPLIILVPLLLPLLLLQ